jgi:hypothetical protein
LRPYLEVKNSEGEILGYAAEGYLKRIESNTQSSGGTAGEVAVEPINEDRARAREEVQTLIEENNGSLTLSTIDSLNQLLAPGMMFRIDDLTVTINTTGEYVNAESELVDSLTAIGLHTVRPAGSRYLTHEGRPIPQIRAIPEVENQVEYNYGDLIFTVPESGAFRFPTQDYLAYSGTISLVD